MRSTHDAQVMPSMAGRPGGSGGPWSYSSEIAFDRTLDGGPAHRDPHVVGGTGPADGRPSPRGSSPPTGGDADARRAGLRRRLGAAMGCRTTRRTPGSPIATSWFQAALDSRPDDADGVAIDLADRLVVDARPYRRPSRRLGRDRELRREWPASRRSAADASSEARSAQPDLIPHPVPSDDRLDGTPLAGMVATARKTGQEPSSAAGPAPAEGRTVPPARHVDSRHDHCGASHREG